MSDLIYSVKEIFTTYLNESKYEYFNIPDYQRGYKWDENDVRKLLEDLKKFEESNPSKGAFYCLQNITLVPNTEPNTEPIKVLNVVDGQQRLTTLYILLSYFKNCKKDETKDINFNSDILKYSIRESTRESTKEKLEAFYSNKDNIWGKIDPAQAEHRDEFYILTVAQEIKKWFKDNTLKYGTVWDNVKLIVNKLDDKKDKKTEEKVFANINGGKVPLDGADLVRAVLMTKSAKEKYTEFKSLEKTNEFRVRMGMEIDNINRWWSKEDVQKYFGQFLTNKIEKNSNFNQKDYPISLLYKIFYEIYKEKLPTKTSIENFSFEFFEYGTDFDGKNDNDYYEMYQKILSLHLTLKDWYKNQEIYHLLGYLLFNFKGETISLNEIWKEWECAKSKNDFTDKLKKMISNELENFIDIEDSEKTQNINRKEKFLERIENIQHDWFHSDGIEKLLPLLDVINIIKIQKKGKNNQNGRIPVAYFKKNDEDKEHIMCQHPRHDEEEKGIRTEDAISFLEEFFVKPKEFPKVKELIKELKNNPEFISKKSKTKFDSLLHEYSLNSLGNIVLLDKSVNRSYKNALHYEKVNRITSEFFDNNHYIRPFTASVFLEKNSKNIKKEWRWGIEEIRENAIRISHTISEYLGW